MEQQENSAGNNGTHCEGSELWTEVKHSSVIIKPSEMCHVSHVLEWQ